VSFVAFSFDIIASKLPQFALLSLKFGFTMSDSIKRYDLPAFKEGNLAAVIGLEFPNKCILLPLHP
jgi:hypothetical protein